MKNNNVNTGKTVRIIYWIATIWLALGMLSTGMVQLFKLKGQSPGSLDAMTQLGYPEYFVTLLGIAKISGVIVILVPNFLLLKEWAYAGFFFMMGGAVFAHIAAGNPIGAIFPSLLLLVLTVVSWYFRPANRRLTLVRQ